MLIASVLTTSSLAFGQLMYGYFSQKSLASRNMAIATFVYSVLCFYYLLEPGLPDGFRIIPVLLFAAKLHFIYHALRRDYGLHPSDKSELILLAILLPLAVAVLRPLDFRIQQSLYALFVLSYFTKSMIITISYRSRLPSLLAASIIIFSVAYPLVFLVRTTYLWIVPPLSEFYVMEQSSIYMTAILLFLYIGGNLGVQIAAAIRAENRIRSVLDSVMDEKDFATGLVKIIGHDLRNYLGTLSSAGSAVMDQNDPVIPIIKENADKAQNLLIDLVYWGRSRSGNSVNPEGFIPGSLLVELGMDDVKRAAEARNIGIDTTLVTDLIKVDVTGARVVLRNILTNALNFSQTGDRIAISALRHEDSLIISVSDEGPGMNHTLLEDIRSGRYTQSAKGTGTGLQIVTSICESSGWPIQFESSPGSGTRISVRFPIALEE